MCDASPVRPAAGVAKIYTAITASVGSQQINFII